jgi:hypothetical protein
MTLDLCPDPMKSQNFNRCLIHCITLITVSAWAHADSAIRISEFLTINNSGIEDEDGDNSDWIEIHNISDFPINTANWSLSDDIDNPGKWTLPSRTLQPNDRLLIFASDKDRTPVQSDLELHTNFKLSGSGEYLGLFEPNGTVATEFSPGYPVQFVDISFGYGIPQSEPSLAEKPIFYPEPTPNAPESKGALGFIKDSHFAIKRGFFDSPFSETVTCATSGTTLIYTTDGSIPTWSNGTAVVPTDEDSTAISEILISETTTLRVAALKPGWQASDIDTQTYLFLDDVLQQDGSGLQPHAAWGDLGQPDWEMDPEIVDHPTWGTTLKDDLKSLPTVSITADWQDLFGNGPQGIYVEGESDPRDCSVEYFVPDASEPGFHINASVQIQGGSSTGRWKVDKLSMRLKFKSEFDSRDMVYQLYPDSPVQEFDTLILAAGHNLVWHHGNTNQSGRAGIVREQVVADLQLQMTGQGATHHARFVHLYLNGLYWGLFALQERPDQAFAASYFGGAEDDYTVMKHNSSTVVNGTATDYGGLLSQTRKNQAADSIYQETENILDIPWLIHYLILNHWAGSYDWAHQNWYSSFNHKEPDGRWRFHSWDTEHVFYALDHMVMSENDTTQVFNTNERDDTGSPVEIHYNLINNADYRLKFTDHIQKRLKNGGELTPNNLLRVFEKRVAEIEKGVNGEAARWGDTNEKTNGSKYSKSDWLKEIDWLRHTYLLQRTDIVIQQYKDRGWFPDEGEVTFAPFGGNLQEDGSVEVGTDEDYIIYLTTDGSDPRSPNGEISDTAIVHNSGEEVTLNKMTTLKARSKSPTDEWGPLTEAVYQIGVIAPVSSENLVLSEFHYNPGEASLDELSDVAVTSENDFEFIEFINVLDDQIVDISKAVFADGINFEFPESSFLKPRERIIIVSNLDAFKLRYKALTPTLNILGAYAGNLSNGGETLILVDRNGDSIVSIDYKDNAPWPESADGEGYSLLYDLKSTDPNNGTNWQSSLQLNGTPGYADTLTYLEWASTIDLVGEEADDTDKDSLSNLAEYFFGTDSNSMTQLRSVSNMQVKEFSSLGVRNDYLSIVYRKSLSISDLNDILEFSRDLNSWTEYSDTRLIESVENLGNGMEEIVVRSPFPLTESLESQFLRIRIKQKE